MTQSISLATSLIASLRSATAADLAAIHARIADLKLELALLHEAKRALALHLVERAGGTGVLAKEESNEKT